jgi:hypothetical protein
MVETTVPALGQTVNSQDIEELPLVNRDVYSLANLESQLAEPYARRATSDAPSVSFGRAQKLILPTKVYQREIWPLVEVLCPNSVEVGSMVGPAN